MSLFKSKETVNGAKFAEDAMNKIMAENNWGNKIPNDCLIEITRLASTNNINYLRLGIRFITLNLVPSDSMEGYEDIHKNSERIINVKVKMIRSKEYAMSEASCVYEVLVPFTKYQTWVCRIGIFANGSTNNKRSKEENDRSLQYYAFLVAKSFFDSNAFITNVKPLDDPSNPESSFFPNSLYELQNVCAHNFDTSVVEKSNQPDRKNHYDVSNTDDETSLDEVCDVKNVHTEKDVSNGKYVINTFVRGINC